MKQHDDIIAKFSIDVDSHPGGDIESYGAGTAFSPYDAAYIGRGRSERAAADDALEQLAQSVNTEDRWGMDRISEAVEELSDSEDASEEAEADCYAEYLLGKGLDASPLARQNFYDSSADTFELSAALYVRFGPPDSKEEALARFLDTSVDSVEGGRFDTYGADTFDADGGTYVVCNDDEANDAVSLYIADSLWAFRPEFLVNYVPCVDYAGEYGNDARANMIHALERIQEACEDANPAIRAMIGGAFDMLVVDAIGADGRGHFLSPYDGSEGEAVGPDGEALFIYRTN